MRIKALFISLVLCALALAGPASAELTQQGKLLVGFNGGLSPKTLPRNKPAPVAVKVEGDIKTTQGAPLPQLRTITVAINRAGRLYDKGLPTCNVDAIQPATEAEAQTLCHRSIVGSGHVSLQAHIQGQHSFPVEGKLLAFNGPKRHGKKIVLAQVYSRRSPRRLRPHLHLEKATGALRHGDEHHPARRGDGLGLPDPLRHDPRSLLSPQGRDPLLRLGCLLGARGLPRRGLSLRQGELRLRGGAEAEDDGGAELPGGVGEGAQ